MQKFLIVKTSSLGDIIQAFPVASYLKRKFPLASLDWVVESPFAELAASNQDINEIIAIDTKIWRKNPCSRSTWKDVSKVKKKIQSKKYNAVFDLQGNIKSGMITFFTKAEAKIGFGWENVAEKPNLLFTNQKFTLKAEATIREGYLELVQSFFNDKIPFFASPHKLKLTVEQQSILNEVQKKISLVEEAYNPKIMICPGSAWSNKQLTTKALIDFLHRLYEKTPSLFLLAWGTQAEFKLAQELYKQFPANSLLMDRLPLPVLQNFMDQVDLVIAMDSLPLHLAGTTKTKTFSIFGPSLAYKYKPQGDEHIALQGQCPYNRHFEKRCPILRSCSTGACIKTLTGDQLFSFYLKQQKIL